MSKLPLLFLRPTHLLKADNVLSCTDEQGLMAGVPYPRTTNKGHLKLRTSGDPEDASSYEVKLQTGGNPTGYADSDRGFGTGASIIWRKPGDSSDEWRGFIDSMYLTKVEYPVAYVAGGHSYPSTARTLANGDLGFMIAGMIGTAVTTFYRVSASTGVVASQVFGSGVDARVDFVVLPSGRLVAVCDNPISGLYSRIGTYYSDDNGDTWDTLNTIAYYSTPYRRNVCVEYSGDMIVAVIWDDAGANTSQLLVSKDGGHTFDLVEDMGVKVSLRMCVTATGTILLVERSAINCYASPIIPGGPRGTAVTIGPCYTVGVPVVRDDGVIFVYRFQPQAAIRASVALSISTDGGITWTDPTDKGGGSQMVVDSEYVSAIDQFVYPSGGSWKGAPLLLLHTQANTGTDRNIQMLTFGGWSNLPETRAEIESYGQPYEHVWTPVDYPSAMGWASVVVGAGATVTNQPWLRIVSTGADNTHYRSAAAFYPTLIGSTKRIRFRVRVNSGGSTSDNRSHISFIMTDGVNEQELKLRFSTTSMVALDGAGNTLGTVTLDQTGWVDWMVGIQHDSGGGGQGRCGIWHRTDAEDMWINDLASVTIAEVVGLRNRIEFGGTAAGVCSWDWAFIAVAEDSAGFHGVKDVPDDLQGRPLDAAADVFLNAGVYVGARNGFGFPGDVYDVEPTYSYPKESVWLEHRPSRQVRSSIDDQVWDIRFYAGTASAFAADTVAILGTNMRRLVLEMNASNTWATPSLTVPLDAGLESFTVGASARGLGFFGPAASPGWRPSQYRSDGDAHRFFVEVGENAYEITDNDQDRLYVEGIDFSAVTGVVYIFGDRMATRLPREVQLAYARVSAVAQPTADNEYHLGTVILGRAVVLPQRYDHGFVDRTEPSVEVVETDAGYRSASRIGPRRYTLAIQWPPVDRRGVHNTEQVLADFFAAIEGSHLPFVVWRDTGIPTDIQLVRATGVLSRSNVWGEGRGHTLTRIDQLILEEEL